MIKVVSVNVGLPKQISYGMRQVVTSIFKEPIEGRVKVTTLNLTGMHRQIFRFMVDLTKLFIRTLRNITNIGKKYILQLLCLSECLEKT